MAIFDRRQCYVKFSKNKRNKEIAALNIRLSVTAIPEMLPRKMLQYKKAATATLLICSHKFRNT